MTSRTQTFNMRNWNGGLNTADDPALVAPNEFTALTNVVMDNSPGKKYRGGFSFFDYIASSTHRSSSGTTRTLRLTVNAGEYLKAGDSVSIVTQSEYNSQYDTEKVTLLTANYATNAPSVTITYTAGTSLTESNTADTDIRVGKYSTSNIIGVKDFWYTSANAQVQARLAVDGSGNFFKYASDGSRNPLVVGTAEVTTVVNTIKADYGTSEYYRLYSAGDVFKIYVWFDKSGADADPAPATYDHGIRVNISSATTAAQVAALHTAAIDAHPDFSAATSGNNTVITNARGGATTDASDINITPAAVTVTVTTAGAGTTTTLTTPITRAYFATLGNKLLITFSGVGNKPFKWLGGTNAVTDAINRDYADVSVQGTNPLPDLEFTMVHQGRIWAKVKTDEGRVLYSDIEEAERWNGEGDSGAIQFVQGDGDAFGLSAILPPNKGRLCVAKGNQLYQISGEVPFSQVIKISDGVGAISHLSCAAVDQDDVAFASLKGWHSLSATDAFGDFSGKFLSQKIQADFDSIDKSALNIMSSTYFPGINSILWTTRASTATSDNNMYLYNIPHQAWYKWDSSATNFSAYTVGLYNKSNVLQLIIGGNNGRLFTYVKTATKDLLNTNISCMLRSGIIYPDNNPTSVKGFKQAGVIFKTSTESANFNIRTQVDNYDVQVNNIEVVAAGTDELGTSFVLGSSALGTSDILLPENISIDGYGYGIVIEINSISKSDFYGYTVDYEAAGDQQEVIRNA